PAGTAVIGMNIGTYLQSKVVMQAGQVMRRMKADTIANTAVNAQSFAEKLEIFRQAVILRSGAQMRELQARLREHHLFAGKEDGNYSLVLRSAIEAYEEEQGLPVTGLATQAVLQALQR